MPIAFTRLCVALLVLAFGAAGGAAAQTAVSTAKPAASSLLRDQQAALAKLAKRADGLDAAVEDNAEDDARLVDLRLQADELEREILGSGVAFRPRLAAINDRLNQLGASPPAGQPPEPPAVTAERQSLLAEKAQINTVLGTAEDLSVRVGSATDRIANLRRALFTTLLTRRTPINSALLGDVAGSFKDEAQGLGRSLGAWGTFVLRFKLQSMLAACFFALLVAAAFLVVGRRLFGRILHPDPAAADPSTLARLATAFWSTVLPSAAVALFLSTVWLLFDYFSVLRGDIGAMLHSLFQVVGIVYFVHRLSMMVLAPGLPNWRLIPVQSRAASVLVWLVSATAVFTGLDFFLGSVFQIRGSPLTLTVGESFVSTVVTGILIALIGLVRPLAHPDGSPKRWPALARTVLFTLAALTILPALAGYIGFARFASRQAVVTGAILGLMYVGLLLARAIAEEGALAGTTAGRRLRARYSLDDTSLDQIALALSIAVNLLVVLFGLPFILLQWGFQPGDLEAWALSIGSGFTVGSFRFSPGGLLAGIVIFALGFGLTRWFQNWLDGSVMARGRVDSGVRNSIRLFVGYAGVALAGLFAVSAAGINLSSFALVAGALSVGIGFGLQNIVNNFVSGLILLVERPFKVGDWIVAGSVAGTVKKISVRATEVETFQRQTVILPNSDLINSAVGNWTHRNKLGRVDIKVNAAYGSNVHRVDDVLTEVVRGHPLVLKNPEPMVLFQNFGAGALEFEVRVFLADILTQNGFANDLRFAIADAFDREGIEMPSTTPRAQGAQAPAKDEAPPEAAPPETAPPERSRRNPGPA